MIRPKTGLKPINSIDLTRNPEEIRDFNKDFPYKSIDFQHNSKEKSHFMIENMRNYVKGLVFPKEISIKSEKSIKSFKKFSKEEENKGKNAKNSHQNAKNSYNSLRKNHKLNNFLNEIKENSLLDYISRNLSQATVKLEEKAEKTRENPLKKPVNFENFKVSKKYSHVKGNMSKTPKIQNLFNISKTQMMILNRKPEKNALLSPVEAIQAFYKQMLNEKNSKKKFEVFFENDQEGIKIKE